MKTTDSSRQSCGYRTGILLHRAHGEELCALCAVLDAQPPDEPEPRQAAARAAKTVRKIRDYDFPSIF